MIDPTGMTLQDYADSVILSLSDAWPLARLDDESRWQDWGAVIAAAYSSRNLPDPYQFDDWRDWARRIYPLLEATN